MSEYSAPTRDMEFVLNELVGLDELAALPGLEEATPDLVSAVLEEAGKLAAEVLAPLSTVGDRQGSRLADGVVHTPEGWKEAYRAFVDGGWNGLAFDPEHGGQGLPWAVSTAVQEMWHASNMAFGLCPLLTQGAVEAILLHGSEEQKQRYLPKLITGEWAGTMNLTEPQAGSDLSAVRTRAVPEGDHYLITGQKIFITYGDHDLTDNIIHLVLARTPDAPEGVKGISLFIVPKFRLDENGNPGERNDVRTVSLEEKLGIHASPTCVLSYGDNGGAVGYLVGEENKGLVYMFTMMNLARHAVGVEGVAIAERAYQRARAYAMDRVQGRPVGVNDGDRVSIVNHPDVRRMLLSMKSQVEAARAVALVHAAAFDRAHRHPDEAERARQQELVDLLTPVVKGWSTEIAQEIVSTGLQVHGGMGFIEETGAAQHYRDVRITTIYEGTTGIQANDLVGRKVIRDGGEAARRVIGEMRDVCGLLGQSPREDLHVIQDALEEGVTALDGATRWILEAAEEDPRLPFAASVPYLRLWGTVAGGWQMGRAALAASRRLDAGSGNGAGDGAAHRAKLDTARFYAEHVLPQAAALERTVRRGSATTVAFDIEHL